MGIKTKHIWMNGRFVNWDSAKVHIMTHSLHYGSAVFEGIHSYKTNDGTAVFRLDNHIERMFRSAGAMGMKLKFSKNQLKNAIKNLIRKNRLSDAYIRPIAYYGYGSIGVYPKNVNVNIAIITVPWKHYYPGSLRVMTSRFIRHSERETVYGTKISGNYANSILAMNEARKKGFDEALMLDPYGYVSEGPSENIFIVKKGNLITPNSRSALPGITVKSILEISKYMGLNAYEKKVTLKEIRNADELFFCGTATEIAPIKSVDGRKIGSGRAGEITLKIRSRYNDIVRGRDRKYIKWLSFV